uniref:YIPF6like protein putative n=1 Tax=Albugo laibachii Nc14 TaxID=890382 RepID=F0WNG4_9STRA|nr:YIPF6like protein putative [Albugo laibachii Nc14]|eukprot:CCA22855.1 YIPF6like protein putative [Albugo laibachii Nc14]
MNDQVEPNAASGMLTNSENTLDEPVSVTILRDVNLVAGKLKVVLMPRNTSDDTLKALRDWDLWGPLMLCLSLSM